MTSRFLRNAVVLGLISAIGPFAIDMYLPALPTIAENLHASTAATQMTLMAFFIAFGVCQIVYGPVSDMVGRKAPLYFGLVVYALGAAGCALAPSIGWLIAFRALQGVGAASVMVIPRAIIRDLHTGVEGARLMALVMLVHLGVADPGAGDRQRADRAVRLAGGVRGGDGGGGDRFALVATLQPETLAPENRVAPGAGEPRLRLRDAARRSALPRADLHRRARHGELLHLPGQRLVHLHRPLRPGADGVLDRLLAERHRLHRLLAVRRLARRALRARPAGDGFGRRLCGGAGRAAGADARRASTACPC